MNYKIKKISGDASFRDFYRLKKNNKTSIIVSAKKDKYKNLIVYSVINNILNSNKIIVLDKGEIKEIGSHRDLLKIDNGYYKKLFELQFQKEELVS